MSENFSAQFTKRRLWMLKVSYRLLEGFLLSSLGLVILVIGLWQMQIHPASFLFYVFVAIGIELVVFWSGIIGIYLSSVQLGIRWRVLGVVLGMLPILNLVVLIKIILISRAEVKFETEKLALNATRKREKICQTKYPILLVHGVFFRDMKTLNYWGRIPNELKQNGATIFYGNHSSALSVHDSARELTARINEILEKTGAKKVNIIAHSKGGLDARYAISRLGMADKVASLVMINTPNRGCEFADYLLSKVSDNFLHKVEHIYNCAAKKLGDPEPDFVSAVQDLTSSACAKMNREVKNSDKVYYLSVGSQLVKASGGKFPLNLTKNFVQMFDGENDGLVGKGSFKMSQDYIFLIPKSNRGISHGDVIDLNRENIVGFDVREFYVQIVRDLKAKGF